MRASITPRRPAPRPRSTWPSTCGEIRSRSHPGCSPSPPRRTPPCGSTRSCPSTTSGRAWLEFDFLFRILVLLSSIALFLSLAGIYPVTAFTVSRRTREIGIRVALGAGARQVVKTIFRRSLAQVALGVLAGGGLTAALAHLSTTGGLSAGGAALVVAYAALMMGVCMLACIVPTRRALGVEPTEALRADG